MKLNAAELYEIIEALEARLEWFENEDPNKVRHINDCRTALSTLNKLSHNISLNKEKVQHG